MATLRLKEFRCVEGTEAGDDSPYFLVFEGDPARPAAEADLVVVRRSAWDNDISSGSFRSVNAVIEKDVDTSHLVLCALMEEDDDRDIDGEDFQYVRKWLRAFFEAYRASGAMSAKSLAAKLKPEFRRALNETRTDDDILGIVQVPVTTTNGLLPLRNFYGDGGHYRVRFETES
jgi:hypothetical protein